MLCAGRIDRLVQCSLPDSEARLKIFESISQSSSLKLESDVDFSVFCNDSTNNYTAADIKSILVTANMTAVKTSIDENLPNEKIPRRICISQKHIVEAFENTKPSLSYADEMKFKSL